MMIGLYIFVFCILHVVSSFHISITSNRYKNDVDRSSYSCSNRNVLLINDRMMRLMMTAHKVVNYEDMANDLGSDEDDDDMEEQMAKELYDELRGNNKELTPQQFLAWEDIQDTIEDGILDTDLIAAILNEVGIKVNDKKNNSISFEKFKELVNLVNFTIEAIENGEEFSEDDEEGDEDDDDDGIDDIGEDIFTQRFPNTK